MARYRRARLGCWHFWRDRRQGGRHAQIHTNACRRCRGKAFRKFAANAPVREVRYVNGEWSREVEFADDDEVAAIAAGIAERDADLLRRLDD